MIREPKIIAAELKQARQMYQGYQMMNVSDGRGGIDELKSMRLSLASDPWLEKINDLRVELRAAVKNESAISLAREV